MELLESFGRTEESRTVYFHEQNILFEIFVEFSQSKLQTKELTTSLIWSVFDTFQSNNGWAFFLLLEWLSFF